mmetsp:Transcript_31230/g.42139  ORF Transcript_31230/g.42139 Transcript_31230/m.42139 type:complete len:125 (+) Transcript_31230:514-888(+)
MHQAFGQGRVNTFVYIVIFNHTWICNATPGISSALLAATSCCQPFFANSGGVAIYGPLCKLRWSGDLRRSMSRNFLPDCHYWQWVGLSCSTFSLPPSLRLHKCCAPPRLGQRACLVLLRGCMQA